MSLLHYITYKYVIIKDKRLGVAYYSVFALISLYTLVQIFINKGYLRFDTSPQGTMRIIVTTPPAKLEGLDQRPGYCCTHDNCTQCRSLDGLSLYWPVESRAVTITSYMKERFEKQQVCDQPTYDYANQHTSFTHVWERDFYTVHPENSLIKIEHSITADAGGFSGSHRKMEGRLVDSKGKTMKKMKANAVNKIYLNDFLKAAGLNLSDISDAVNADGRSYRRMGIVLHVLVDYRNSDAYWFGVGHTSYTYRVHHVPLTDYRVKQEIPVVSANGSACQRIVNKRFGPRLEFHQVGKIGQYSVGNLLMQFVSFMGLLTLTATIVDVFALYLVPAKEKYRQYVYDASPEFGRGVSVVDEHDQGKEKEE